MCVFVWPRNVPLTFMALNPKLDLNTYMYYGINRLGSIREVDRTITSKEYNLGAI